LGSHFVDLVLQQDVVFRNIGKDERHLGGGGGVVQDVICHLQPTVLFIYLFIYLFIFVPVGAPWQDQSLQQHTLAASSCFESPKRVEKDQNGDTCCCCLPGT